MIAVVVLTLLVFLVGCFVGFMVAVFIAIAATPEGKR